MKVRNKKAGVGITLAASVAAVFGGLLAASPAEAACASFWGMGNSAQCTSTFGNTAVALDDEAVAVAAGGFGNTSIGSGLGASATSTGLFSTAIALGQYTTATSAGVGAVAVDIGTNTYKGSGSATSVGWFNRAINVGGGDNTAVAISGSIPKLDIGSTPPVIDIGNNTALNVGSRNLALVGSVAPGLPGGFSNGVYNIGNDNLGLAGGAFSNLIQIGNENYTPVKIPAPYQAEAKGWQPHYITIPTPNTAVGLGAENLVVGNNNEANARGNLVGVVTLGNGNKHNVTGASQLPGGKPFDLDLNLSAVIGDDNNVDVKGKNDVTTTVGNENKVKVRGNTNLTTVFGNHNRLEGHHYSPGVEGNNNITTSFGNDNKIGVKGNSNLTTNFGNRNRLRSTGDGNVNSNVGDDKTSEKTSPSTP